MHVRDLALVSIATNPASEHPVASEHLALMENAMDLHFLLCFIYAVLEQRFGTMISRFF